MEHTKGELETDQSCINCIDLLSKEDDSIVAQIMECDEDELSITQRANAEELVRRWNASEKDGLVDELLAASKDALKKLEWPIYTEREKLKMRPCRDKLKAAIAKATQKQTPSD